MKKFFTIFFVTLGVIFSLVILLIIYLFIFDPFNVKPLLFGSGPAKYTSTSTTSENNATDTNTASTTQSDNNLTLSEAQKSALKSFGIDPATVPASLSAEQSACFRGKLGDERYAQVKGGAVPTAIEFFNAKSCI